MWQKLISFIVVFLTIIPLHAQCTWFGIITDQTDNSPLPGAIIYLPDLKKGATTDTAGFFKIVNVPAGNYLAEIKLIGYSSISSLVNPCAQSLQNFSMSTSVIETKEVLITGSSKATELLKMPGAAATIDRLALFKTSANNIIDAISNKPGISQVTTGAGISKPVIRGLGYNRIITLNDGIRQEGQQWGDEHGMEIDEFSANKIEILKGPVSLMYGSDAMAGVINILSQPSPPQGTINGTLTTHYQSNNDAIGISAMQNGWIKSFNWMLRGSLKSAGNYKNQADGIVFNSGFNERNISGVMGINKKWGYSHLILSSFHQNIGLIEGDRDSLGNFLKMIALNDSLETLIKVGNKELNSRNLWVPYQNIRHSKLAVDNTFIMGQSRLSLLFAFQHNVRKEFGNIHAADLAGLYLSLKSYTLDAKYFLPEKNQWQITLGANGMLQANENRGEEALIPNYRQWDAGVFLYLKKELSKSFNMAGGIRLDGRHYRNDALIENQTLRFLSMNKNYGNISGGMGATYSYHEKFTLKANIARGYRAPQASETSSNGRHEGTFRYEIGNNALVPETSVQGDLGWLYQSEHISMDVALFSNNINHFIYLKKLRNTAGGDSIVDVNDPAPAYQFVQGKAALNGAEISVDIHPHPFHWMHFENTFSIVNAINKGQPDSSKYLPFTPATRVTTELQADIKKLNSHLSNFYFSLNAQFYLRQDHVLLENATETPTPGYTIFNAAIGADVKSKKGTSICSIVLSASNLLDVAYQSHLNRLKYAPVNQATGSTGVFNTGRNFGIKMLLPLSFKKADLERVR